MSLTFLSLFAGIEGFGAGFESAGMKCVGQVEIDPQCRNVLARHYPGVERFTDVKDFSAASTAIRPDLICGGFPCQDLSVAGKRAGLAGERSGLYWQVSDYIYRCDVCGDYYHSSCEGDTLDYGRGPVCFCDSCMNSAQYARKSRSRLNPDNPKRKESV